ncbi:ATP-dependent endonuclease [Streptomyces rubiginosohelvolus]|uniref:ATP-dependent endonuclease n=1 Tax=Streptomyces rubiginosohelvolus TaxID=67362 RepID=UPI0035D5703A
MTNGDITIPSGFRLKRYLANQRQFAEAVLASAVLVVEGATEAALFPIVSDVLDRDSDPSLKDYIHIDLAGVTVFDAQGDTSVPLFAPVFKAMGKPVYGIHDTPTSSLTADAVAKAGQFTRYEVISYSGVEELLATEVPVDVQRRFLAGVAARSDYPQEVGFLDDYADEASARKLTTQVLKKKKGDGYAALLISQCKTRAELPSTLASLLVQIDLDLRGAVAAAQAVVATHGDSDSGSDEA